MTISSAILEAEIVALAQEPRCTCFQGPVSGHLRSRELWPWLTRSYTSISHLPSQVS
jgi:hypothetical protein